MTVNVEGMLCAQALAVVDQALKPLPPGAPLEVRGASPDVVADLTVWAKDRGYPLTMQPDGAMVLRRGTA